MFEPQAKVQLRSDVTRIGIVRSLKGSHAGQRYYEVFWGGSFGTTNVREGDLLPYQEHGGPFEWLASGRLAGYDQFQDFVTRQRLRRDGPLRNNIYSFNASRTRFLPYQFKPLLKFLESPRHRLLIADEVGLGKTVEAGLILTEMQARQEVRLCLVICPSNLREKWKLELWQRFNERFEAMASRELLLALDDYEERPDRTALRVIVSLETLRQKAVTARLDELAVPFDLVIVDEAHHIRNFGTAQRAGVVAATRAATALLLLTATPVQLGISNLYSLLRVLDEDEFSDEFTTNERILANAHVVQAERALGATPASWTEAAGALRRALLTRWLRDSPPLVALAERCEGVAEGREDAPDRAGLHELRADLGRVNLLGHIVTRTRKRQVHDQVAVRRAVRELVDFTPRERALYDLASRVVRERCLQRGDNPLVSAWALNTPQRMLSSCLSAWVARVRASGLDSLEVEESDPEEAEQAELGPLPVASESPSLGVLSAELREMVNNWPDNAVDSKYERLTAALRELDTAEPGAKVVVFASFRATVHHLSARLARDGWSNVAMSGLTPAAERSDLVRRFRDEPAVRVMVASRVGSEGLDFQFASTVVNYDLPWNPMEVEQRIGRVDRIGQRSEVIRILNFWVTGTIEERILRRLYERIGVFERSIGELEPILGELTAEIQRTMMDPALTAEEEEARVEQLAEAHESRRHQAQGLERQMAELMGSDELFEEEIKAILGRRRFVTPEQMRRFLVAFLRRRAPRTLLEYDEAGKIGRIEPDEELRKMIQRSGRASESTGLLASVGGSLPITFDAEAALARPGIEFISVLHPLVRIAVEEEEAQGACTAFVLACQTSLLRPGVYPFGVYRVRVTGARTYAVLETVVLTPELDGEACDGSDAEALLGEMVERGEPLDASPELVPGGADAIRGGIETALLARLARLREGERRVNDAFVDQRLRSIEVSSEKRLRELHDRRTKEEAGQRRERYLKLLAGQRAKAESELERHRAALEAGRALGIEHAELAVGLVEVSRP